MNRATSYKAAWQVNEAGLRAAPHAEAHRCAGALSLAGG